MRGQLSAPGGTRWEEEKGKEETHYGGEELDDSSVLGRKKGVSNGC